MGKRGHELDNYGQPFEGLSPKRRRCSTNRSAFAPSNSSKSATQERKLDVQSLSDGLSDPISQFPRMPTMETSEILSSVTANYRQLKRRRLLPPKSPKQNTAPGGVTPPRTDPRSSPPSSSSDSDDFSATQKIKKSPSRFKSEIATVQKPKRHNSPCLTKLFDSPFVTSLLFVKRY